MAEVKIAFLMLVHKDPDAILAQARALSGALSGGLSGRGDCVAIHVDRRMPAAQFARIEAGLAGLERVALAPRQKCGWGEWSLVAATLALIRTARKRFGGITHYHLLSGDCYPIKPRGHFEAVLGAADRDIIEAEDFFESGWIKTGLVEERLVYRHYFNERERPKLFYGALALQQRLGLRRRMPKGIRPRIGSQWWCLRAVTVERLLRFIAKRRDVIRFFRRSWIPDETFFQTLVRHLVAPEEISGHPPTFLIFSDYGMPVVFQSDHYDFLRGRDRFFARKVSPHDTALRERLLETFAEPAPVCAEPGGGAELYGYLAKRGRHGERYAQRFWERAIAVPEDRELLVVAAKLWHVGKAAGRAMAETAGLPALDYMFDEDVDLPVDLGNLESGLAKRGRHRRAFINLVFDALKRERILFCIDPARRDVIGDLVSSAGNLRICLVERPVSEAHLLGHAERVGLLGPGSGRFERDEVRAALRHEFEADIARLRRDYGPLINRNTPEQSREENVLAIGHFLRVRRDPAEAIARALEKLG